MVLLEVNKTGSEITPFLGGLSQLSHLYPMTDPWCCYIWCAMDPIKKKTLYVSIFLPAPWILGVFALELWLSTDTLWDDPPRSEQELLQQIQSTEPHFIRSLPYWQKPRSSFCWVQKRSQHENGSKCHSIPSGKKGMKHACVGHSWIINPCCLGYPRIWHCIVGFVLANDTQGAVPPLVSWFITASI